MSEGPGKSARDSDRIAPSYTPRQAEKPAPCQGGCPNCGDIRGWIATVAQHEKTGLSREESYGQAWRIITDVNPFPATLGRICPHPCESHCNRSELDEPLAINAMERFLGDFAIDRGLPLPTEDTAAGDQWIGVVGAGPSGLSFAYQMARRGYRVTVYDARSQAGGMLRFGVPDYRLPQRVLDAEIERILDLGVELRLRTRVGRDISLDELQQRHHCLYLGIGAQGGRALRIPGAEGPNVHTGVDYLGKINRGETVPLGRRVVVVGGGNTAVDAARCARRSGAIVTLLYRRTREEMPAIAQEVDDAVAEGVELVQLAAPAAILRNDANQIRAVRAQRMQLGEVDASGRRSPVAIEGAGLDITADSVILAVSQVPVLQGLDILQHERGWLVADQAAAVGENVLVGGDAMGLGIAGEAIAQGRRAAEALHARLCAETPAQDSPTAPPAVTPERLRVESKPRTTAARKPERPPQQRVREGMAEVAGNITETEFLAEVERCFSCGSCFGCEQCYMYCTSGCFTRLEEPRPGMYFALRLDECQQCGKCIEVCPCGYLEFDATPG